MHFLSCTDQLTGTIPIRWVAIISERTRQDWIMAERTKSRVFLSEVRIIESQGRGYNRARKPRYDVSRPARCVVTSHDSLPVHLQRIKKFTVMHECEPERGEVGPFFVQYTPMGAAAAAAAVVAVAAVPASEGGPRQHRSRTPASPPRTARPLRSASPARRTICSGCPGALGQPTRPISSPVVVLVVYRAGL